MNLSDLIFIIKPRRIYSDQPVPLSSVLLLRHIQSDVPTFCADNYNTAAVEQHYHEPFAKTDSLTTPLVVLSVHTKNIFRSSQIDLQSNYPIDLLSVMIPIQ